MDSRGEVELFVKVTIIDGYTDEPAGLGVPPYIDVYPRYIAGAIWSLYPAAEVHYFTVDFVRNNLAKVVKNAELSDLVIFIAGVVVPGKYLGGEPIKAEELTKWPLLIEKPIKVLTGPAARFGFGIEGGKPALPPERLEDKFDLVVKGDPEIVIYNLLKENSVEKVDPSELREGYSLTSVFAVKGAKIVLQHPNYGKNLIAEIETFRGCPRWVTGGCSFCIEPRYGEVVFRDPKDVAREISSLYDLGVKNFRLGRQPDIFVYMSKEVNEEEFPKPNPEAIRSLFSMIRKAAPRLETLHIDNVNPGTIARYPELSKEIGKIIIAYHTPGDVAAMGIESADPYVVKVNNLKASPDEALLAIKIINSIGSKRGYNGLPELLPGINFIGGLLGESPKTYEYNREFLKTILHQGLLVRRVNIRQVLTLPRTRIWTRNTKQLVKYKRDYEAFKKWVREFFDKEMLKRVLPRGTILRGLYVEGFQGKYSLARQVGSYPILAYVTERLPIWEKIDAVIVGYKSRSVIGVPYPLDINKASVKSLRLLPGSSSKIALSLISKRPFSDIKEVEKVVERKSVLKYLKVETCDRQLSG